MNPSPLAWDPHPPRPSAWMDRGDGSWHLRFPNGVTLVHDTWAEAMQALQEVNRARKAKKP